LGGDGYAVGKGTALDSGGEAEGAVELMNEVGGESPKAMADGLGAGVDSAAAGTGSGGGPAIGGEVGPVTVASGEAPTEPLIGVLRKVLGAVKLRC
jgi:hypothetical protein